MTDVKVTQHLLQVDVDNATPARVTQVIVESDVSQSAPEVRVTQVELEGDVNAWPAGGRVTQVVLEVDIMTDPPEAPDDVEIIYDEEDDEVEITWPPDEPYVDETEITECVNGVCTVIGTVPGNPGSYTVTSPGCGSVCYYVVFINANGRSGATGSCLFIPCQTRASDMGTFYITDGTSRVYLIGRGGFKVCGWNAARVPHELRWDDAPLRDGRYPSAMRLLNIRDRMELVSRHPNQNLLIHECQEADTLLTKAIQYWMEPDNAGPVYLVRRAPSEVQPSYAVITDYSLPETDNPYAEPFASRFLNNGLKNLTLDIEHGPWLSQPPGKTECVREKGTGFGEGTLEIALEPLLGYDDAFTDYYAEDVTGNALCFGNALGPFMNAAMRFRNVTIPAGAIINSARVDMVAIASLGAGTANVDIVGQLPTALAPNPDPFGNPPYDLIDSRPVTAASVSWLGVPQWTYGNTYSTPDISAIIQEIINDSTWSSGNDIVVMIKEVMSDFGELRAIASVESETVIGAPMTRAKLVIEYYAPRVIEKGYTRDCVNVTRPPLAAAMNVYAQITHVFGYDAGGAVYTGNLVQSGTPYDLFPNNPAGDGDMLYIGIADTSADYGPFDSVVFNLDGLGVLTAPGALVYEYYDNGGGGSWQPFLWNVNDELDDFQAEAIVGMYFDHIDWMATTVNGVNGYWVRVRYEQNVTGIFEPPQQLERDPFAVTWGCIEVPEGEIYGTLPALATLKIRPVSGPDDHADDYRRWHRIMMGLRSTSRGDDFTAYINTGDTQWPPGVTVSLYGAGIGVKSFVDEDRSPTGRRFDWAVNAASVAYQHQFRINMDEDIATQYMGRFRVFARGFFDPAVLGTRDLFSVRLQVEDTHDVVYARTEPVFLRASLFDRPYGWTDMGVLDLRLPTLTDIETRQAIRIYFDAWHYGTGADVMGICDLCFLPIDEWSGDYWRIETGKSGLLAAYDSMGSENILIIDPTSQPKEPFRALAMDYEDQSQLDFIFQTSAVEPPFLHPQRGQKLWFLPLKNLEFGSDGYRSFECEPGTIHEVDIQAVFRYRGLRGAR